MKPLNPKKPLKHSKPLKPSKTTPIHSKTLLIYIPFLPNLFPSSAFFTLQLLPPSPTSPSFTPF